MPSHSQLQLPDQIKKNQNERTGQGPTSAIKL